MVAVVTVVAHIGHWYHVFLYLAPVVIVAGGLWFAGKRLPEESELADDVDGDGDGLGAC
jgi:hypothetical protein